MTVLSVVGGKFVAVRMLLPSDEEIVDLFVETFDDARLMLTLLSTDVFNELSDAGRLPPVPEGAEASDDSLPEGIPREVWLEAQRRWDAFSDAERQEYQDRITRQLGQAMLPSMRIRMTLFGFLRSFGWQDLLFLALALGTAFKVGSGRTHFEGSPPAYEREAGFGDHPPTTPMSQRRVDERDLEREPGAVSYCPGCGGQFRAGIRFCSDCGTVLALFLGDV